MGQLVEINTNSLINQLLWPHGKKFMICTDATLMPQLVGKLCFEGEGVS